MKNSINLLFYAPMSKKGVIYDTNLCVGTFVNKNSAIVANRTRISCGKIIEKHEWEQGSIDLGELTGYLKQKHQQYLDENKNRCGGFCGTVWHDSSSISENIQLLQMNGSDLFLEESVNPELEYFGGGNDISADDHDEPKYIMVEKNYSYEVVK